ncbi:MAG: 16S rRNA processing protein RimM [Mollicutes bacterium]|nr:16S rRNA processing protein RimM [Mollicutes bacterium]
MKKIFVGKITGAFGIKGELKVLSHFEIPEKVFLKDQLLYLNNEEHLITKVRYHKNKYLIEIDNLNDINLVNQYRNCDIYIDYNKLNLKEDEYLYEELINLNVYNENKLIGQVTEVINDNKDNILIKVNNQFYIPLKSNYIAQIKIKENKIIGKNLEELIL